MVVLDQQTGQRLATVSADELAGGPAGRFGQAVIDVGHVDSESGPRGRVDVLSGANLPTDPEVIETFTGQRRGDRFGVPQFVPFTDVDGDGVFEIFVSVTRSPLPWIP